MEKEKFKKITLYEEDLYEKKTQREETVSITVFRLAKEWYGIKLSGIKGIVKTEDLTFLPSSPEYIVGIFNLRGVIISVTDLKRVFNLPSDPFADSTRIVIVESGESETGILADEVIGIVEVPLTKIEPTLTTISSEKAEFIEGGFHSDGKLIGILSVEKILACSQPAKKEIIK